MRRVGALLLALLAVSALAGCGQSVTGTATVQRSYSGDPYGRFGLDNQSRRVAENVDSGSSLDPCGFFDLKQQAKLGHPIQLGMAEDLHSCVATYVVSGGSGVQTADVTVSVKRESLSGLTAKAVNGGTAYYDPSESVTGTDCASYTVPLKLPNDPGAVAMKDKQDIELRIGSSSFATTADSCTASGLILATVFADNNSHRFPSYTATELTDYPILRHNPCDFFNHLPAEDQFDGSGFSAPQLDIGSCAAFLTGKDAQGDNPFNNEISVRYTFPLGYPLTAGQGEQTRTIAGHTVIVSPNTAETTTELDFQVGGVVDDNLPPIPTSDRTTYPIGVSGWQAVEVQVVVPNWLVDKFAPIALATFAPDGDTQPPFASATSVVPGWQTVVNSIPDSTSANDADGAVAVDVPHDWEVRQQTAPDGHKDMEAFYAFDYCGPGTGASRAWVGLYTGTGTDLGKAASDILHQYAENNGDTPYHPQFSMSAPRMLANGYQDFRGTVAITLPPPTVPDAACFDAADVVHVVVKHEKGGVFAVVVAGQQGIAGPGPSGLDLDKIAATVRPAS